MKGAAAMNTKRFKGLRMNLKQLAALLLPGLLLTGCFDPGGGKTQSPSASVTIDVPALAKSYDGITPAFIDTSTKELLLQVRNSLIGGYDEAPQALVQWYQCILGYVPGVDPSEFYETLPLIIPDLLGQSLSSIEAAHPACGLYPAGHDGHAIVDEKVISSTNPSARFDLPPGKYRFTVTQRSNADGDIAVTTAYATLAPGANALVIQLMYGDWRLDQPLTASLLGGFEDPDDAVNMRLALLLQELSNTDSQIDPQNELISFLRAVGGYWGDTTSPAAVWGVIGQSQPLTLRGVQLKGGRTASTLNDPLANWGRYDVFERHQGSEAYFIPGIGSNQDPVTWLESIFFPSSNAASSSRCIDFYCLLDSYGQAAVSAQGTEWYFPGNESLGMGWVEVSDNGITTTGQTGIASPALLMQQYKQRRNNHRISLGELAFAENNGRGFEQKAGLYFYGLEPQQASIGNLVGNQQKSAWQITDAEASVNGDDALSIYFNLSHLTVKLLGAGLPDLRPTTLDGNKINALVVEYIQYSANSTEYRELPLAEIAPLVASIPDPIPDGSYYFPLDVPISGLGLLVSDQSGVTQRIDRVLGQLYRQQQTGSLPLSSASPGCFVLYEQQFSTSLELNKTGGTWQPPETFDAATSVPTALWVCVHRAGLTAQNL